MAGAASTANVEPPRIPRAWTTEAPVTTDLLHSPTHPREATDDGPTTRLGAGLGVAGIALIMGGFALIAATEATITSTQEEIAAFYTGASLSKVLAGGLL